MLRSTETWEFYVQTVSSHAYLKPLIVILPGGVKENLWFEVDRIQN